MSHRCENTCNASHLMCDAFLGNMKDCEEKHLLLINSQFPPLLSLSSFVSYFRWVFPAFWFTLGHLKDTNRALMNWIVEATWTSAQWDLLYSNMLSLSHYTIHPAAVRVISVYSCASMINGCCCSTIKKEFHREMIGVMCQQRQKTLWFIWDTTCFFGAPTRA